MSALCSSVRTLPERGGERVRYAPASAFHRELRRHVTAYFRATGLPMRGLQRVYVKTGVIVLWTVVSYVALVFAAATWWQGVVAAMSFALAVAAIGFNIQHDGAHGSYSGSARWNRIMAFGLDLLGGSSYLWRWKHNVFHHGYPNIVGADEDLDVGPLARLAPTQPRQLAHRFQHIYMWVLYGCIAFKWQLVDDFRELLRGRIGSHPVPRPRGRELLLFMAGKAAFVTLWFCVPALVHPLWVVAIFYAETAFILGLVLGVVFQTAHCVEGAMFTVPGCPGHLNREWATHQVESTVDFGRGHRLLTWYLGALNYQIEHHLFPRISHLHYPALAPIVEAVCRQYGVRYRALPTFAAAVAAHYRWLRRLAVA